MAKSTKLTVSVARVSGAENVICFYLSPRWPQENMTGVNEISGWVATSHRRRKMPIFCLYLPTQTRAPIIDPVYRLVLSLQLPIERSTLFALKFDDLDILADLASFLVICRIFKAML